MDRDPQLPPNQLDTRLTKDEATKLANEVKTLLRAGQTPAKDAENISKLVAGLGDSRGLLRRTFAEGLGTIGNAALPALCHALRHHPDVTVRRAAAKSLRLVGDPIALPHLLEALINDQDPVVQGSSVGAMATFGEDAVELLLQVLISPTSNATQSGLASWGLAFVGAKAPRALKKAALSKNANVRAAAIAALGEQIQSLNDIEAKSIVINSLTDESGDVRAEATALIGELNEPKWAIPFLKRKLKDSNSHVRINATLALMKLGSNDELQELEIRAKEENDEKVLDVIKLAITRLKK
ncbi:HEAT repeat domain-containing protein [Prochlorococcus sp. MIT 1300]|uniref:HEAT repeat domain-containing protein n=1 Tax=Prochlorococcus sp. MIT 1300 TaxID=3096218 RepID=UPI002A76352D|nr:HEAT repeat domain-containing protein [Prochlorococcus sp. MIT 1300]